MRDEAPVFRTGDHVYLSRYDEARQVLKDQKRYRMSTFADRADRVAETLKDRYSDAEMKAYYAVGRFEQHYMNRSGDGEKHGRLRRIAHRAFTPGRIAAFEETTGTYTDDIIDRARDGAAVDLMSLAYRLPLMIICDMLGVPPEDREKVHAWSGRLGRNRTGTEAGPLMDAHAAMAEFRGYVEEIVARHRTEPDSVSPLVAALLDAEQGERLSEIELTAMFVILLFAGHETTTNLIGIGILELLRHRDQWDRLVADPNLSGGATEELLRFVTPVQWLSREAVSDFEVDGVAIHAGDTVTACLAGANRDATVFPDPDRLDLTRVNSRDHLSLGFGLHFCLGASLARLEGRIVFRRLAERFPDMRLAADPADLGWQGHALLRGLSALPVDLGAAR
jgi:cytochrome P450